MSNSSIIETPYVLTISSGKGGVGKSVLAANISSNLAKQGVKVLLWDANRKFPNCHLMLGVEPPVRLSDVHSGKVPVYKAVFQVSNSLYLLADNPATNVDETNDEISVIDVFRDLILDTNFQVIIIDTPAGISDTLLHAATFSEEVAITITDEPTSLLDGYGLIKYFTNYIDKSKMSLIVNNIIDYDDGKEISSKLNLATEKFLGFDMKVGGFFPYNRAVRKSIVQQELLIETEPDSDISLAIDDFSKNLIEKIGFSISSNYLIENY